MCLIVLLCWVALLIGLVSLEGLVGCDLWVRCGLGCFRLVCFASRLVWLRLGIWPWICCGYLVYAFVG